MAHETVSLTVNGDEQEAAVDPSHLLVHTLREELGYTGTNIGCETGLCGACTVLMDGSPVKSCTLLTVQADGATIKTVEALRENGELHPVQESFSREHGLQCGYCTPGMMLTTLGFLDRNPNPSRDEIREGLEGNLCRCTGYQNIVNAVESTAEKMTAEDSHE